METLKIRKNFLLDREVIEKWLYVIVGLASIGFPSRIGLHPEITLIELK
jgi:predicted MPP superfamily phosphohydrolase